MKIDRRIFPVLHTYKTGFVFSLVCTVLAAGCIVTQAKLISQVISNAFLYKQGLEEILPLLFGLIALLFFRAAAQWCGDYLIHRTGIAVKTTMRRRLMSHVMHLGPAYTRTQQTGEFQNTLTQGIEAIGRYISDYVQQLILAALIPLMILMFVFPLDWLSGLILILTAPLIPIFMILIGDVAHKLTQKQWTLLSRMSAFFLDSLQGLTTLKLLGASQRTAQKIAQATETFRQTTMKVLRIAFLSALTLEWLSTLSTAIIAVQIGLRVLYGRIGFADALFILIIAPEFYLPLRNLGARFHAGMQGFSALQRYFEILEQRPTKTSGKLSVSSFQVIEFRDICYAYPNRQELALNCLNLRIEHGEKIGLVGPSGAGKTTLLYLLCRFMDPQTGDIQLDFQSLGSVNPIEWRRLVSWVPQHPYLFFGTILENIRLAQPRASEKDISNAVQQAGLDRMIAQWPEGLETSIGEGGARLSGGQIQRLALARAFLKKAPILLFDEPTAHLDVQTETEIQGALNELARDKTVITIAHRLSTLQKVDKIVVLHKGRLMEQGSYEALKDHPAIKARAINEESLF